MRTGRKHFYPKPAKRNWRELEPHQWSEAEFQTKIITEAQQVGWWVYHPYFSKRSEAGWPDLYLMHPDGRRLIVELKRNRGYSTPIQRKCHARFRVAGEEVLVWRPRDLEMILETIGALGYGGEIWTDELEKEWLIKAGEWTDRDQHDYDAKQHRMF